MPDVASLIVEVTPKGILETKKQLDGLETQSKETEKQTVSMMDKFRSMQAVMQGPVAAFGAIKNAIGQVYAVAADLVGEFAKSDQALSNLESVLRATGGTAGRTSEQLQDMAEKFQASTLFDADGIIQMNAVLLGFRGIVGDTFDRATTAILDMSQVMGTDLVSAAQMVGKALDDPVQGISALSRVGFVFTDQQKAMIKELTDSGQVMEAQNIILGEMEKAFGGAAKAAGDTATGAFIKLKNSLDDLKESWGGLIAQASQPIVLAIQGELDKQSVYRQIKEAEQGTGSAESATFAIQSYIQALKSNVSFTASVNMQGEVLRLEQKLKELAPLVEAAQRTRASQALWQNWNNQQQQAQTPAAPTGPSENAQYADKVLSDMRESLRLAQLNATLRGEQLSDEEELNIIIGARLKLRPENAQSIKYLEGEIALLGEKLRVEKELEKTEAAVWVRLEEVNEKLTIGEKAYGNMANAMEDSDKAALEYAATMESLQKSLVNLGVSVAFDSLEAIGRYLGQGASGAEDFASSMSDMGMQILAQLPQLLFYAGVQLIKYDPVLAAGLIVASGLVAIGSGIGQAAAAESQATSVASVRSTSSAALSRGNFTQQARAEATPMVVNINNMAPGVETMAQETIAPDGTKQLTVMIESIVQNSFAKGKFDTAMGRYGNRPAGRRL